MKLLILKILSLSLTSKNNVFKFIIFILFIPLLLLSTLVCIPFSFSMIRTVPMADDQDINFYIDAVNKVKKEKNLDLDWKYLVAIDAVMFEQDFSKSNLSHANDLVEKFIYKEVHKTKTPVYDNNGNIISYKEATKVKYKLRSFDDVLGILDFTSDKINDCKTFYETLGYIYDASELANFTPINKVYKWPINCYTITSTFGPRTDPLNNSLSFHYGVDIAAPINTSVVAAKDGVIVTSKYSKSAGNYVTIDHQDGTKTRYLHLNSMLVHEGQEVHAGELIGYSGNTGNTTGPHLHFEIIKHLVPVDPLQYFR